MPKIRQEVSTLNQSRENIFKKIWGKKNYTKFFLQNNLPISIIKLLDFESLIKIPGSFLDSSIQKSYSDILYQVKLKNNGSCYIYLLFEHKANQEKATLSLKLLNCMVRVWEKHKLNKSVKLIPIIPIIIHHKNSALFWESNFVSQFNTPEALERYIPCFQFKLCDLSSIFVGNFSFM